MDSKKIFITISIVLFLAILGYVLLSKQPTAPAETVAEAEATEWERVLAEEAAAVAAEEAAKKAAEAAKKARKSAKKAVDDAFRAKEEAKKAKEEAAKKAKAEAKKAADDAVWAAGGAAKRAAGGATKKAAGGAAKKAADEAAKKFALLRSYTPNGRDGEPVQVKWGYRTGSKRNNRQCDTICRGVGANFYSTSENGHCGCTTNTQVRDISSLMFKSKIPGWTVEWDVKTDYVDYIRVNEE